MINQTQNGRDDQTGLLCPNLKEHRGGGGDCLNLLLSEFEKTNCCNLHTKKTNETIEKIVFCVKIIKGHPAVRQQMLQGFLFGLDTLFLCVSSKVSALSASVCLLCVYFWIQRPPGWRVKSSQMSISTATVEEKTQNTLRMYVPVSPLLFVQLSHVQRVCLDAFDAGWWESHQLFSESWSRTNGSNVRG